jgi:hypothetical protein
MRDEEALSSIAAVQGCCRAANGAPSAAACIAVSSIAKELLFDHVVPFNRSALDYGRTHMGGCKWELRRAEIVSSVSERLVTRAVRKTLNARGAWRERERDFVAPSP